MTAAPSILSLIGNTPLIELQNFDVGPCRLFLKLESQNPGGSIKDRTASSMISAAEKDGRLKPGGTIIEATAGNTGLGLALISALKGYKVILVVPDKFAKEKIIHCQGLGAQILWTRSDVHKGHPEYYIDMAARLAAETGAFHVNQFSNPANAIAHETGTGPELWEQMDQDIDAVVCGVGSGGTMSGLAKYFASVSPKTEMILADPEGSILAPLVNEGKMTAPGSWKVEGIGEDPRDVAILRAIVALAGALDLEVIAEGIETEAQWSAVAREGCAYFQGFIRAKPMSASAFLKLAGGD